MNIILLLVTASLVIANKSRMDEANSYKLACDGVIFNHVYYDKHKVVGKVGRPYNLVMHKFSGTLFFSHTISYATVVDFGIMVCNLAKEDCVDVNGINGGYAIAYDAGNDDIYMGGHDGIYKYNFLTKSAEMFGEQGTSIWALFVRRNFYYIQYPSQKLYVYKDDGFVVVAEARNTEIDYFFVGKYGDIYFANKTALFKIERPSRQVIVLDDEIIMRQISEDGYGDVYFCGSNGVYIEDKPYHRIKRIADIENAFGLTFDERDHPIFSDLDSIYKLVPSDHNQLCYNALTRRGN